MKGVLILVIWLHFYKGASLVLTSVITVTIITGINIFENKLSLMNIWPTSAGC